MPLVGAHVGIISLAAWAYAFSRGGGLCLSWTRHVYTNSTSFREVYDSVHLVASSQRSGNEE